MKSPGFRLSPKNREKAVAMYIGGKSTLEVGKKFGIRFNAVIGLLERRGIPRRSGAPKRVHQLWTGKVWDDGYVDNKGRFRVYRPDFPCAYKGGYALRAHVVWWIEHGERHPKGTELHHIDTNKLNDKLSNLEPLEHSPHQKKHKTVKLAFATCEECGRNFAYPAWRDKDRVTKFCSKKCQHKFPVSAITRKKMSRAMKVRWRKRS